jgi:hypothetical protein
MFQLERLQCDSVAFLETLNKHNNLLFYYSIAKQVPFYFEQLNKVLD